MSVSLTSDIVVVNRQFNILVVRRKNPPFQDQWALPGGYVDEGETFLQAAGRELREETGLKVSTDQLVRLGVYDDPDRDPRGRVVSVAFKCLLDISQQPIAGDDALEVAWRPIGQAGLAFDHDKIVHDAVRMLTT